MIDLIAITTRAETLIRETGNWMKSQRVSASEIEIKTPNNLVSFVDKESERRLVEGLSEIFPEAGFIAEEGTGERAAVWNWVIDPLDGTTNFLHGMPHWAISIALEHKGEIVSAVVFDAAKDELFWAEKGAGAWMNDMRIRVSGRRSLVEGLFATGVPFGAKSTLPATLQDLARLMPACAGVRRNGAAALDLAYVAAGRLDGFFEKNNLFSEIKFQYNASQISHQSSFAA